MLNGDEMPAHAAIREILDGAGRLALTYFRNVRPVWKASRSYVTEADIAIQSYISDRLMACFPEDGIIAEEKDLRVAPKSGARYWVVDPIDGTASFVAGLPVWGTGLALIEDLEPVAGYFLLPTTGDFFYAESGSAVFRCGEPAQMKDPQSLHRESVLLTISRLHQQVRLQDAYSGKVRSMGSTIAHMCYVATGSADAALLGRVHVWDLAPGLAMLGKNGGVLHYLLTGEQVSVADLLDGSAARSLMLCGHPDMVRRYEGVIQTSASAAH